MKNEKAPKMVRRRKKKSRLFTQSGLKLNLVGPYGKKITQNSFS